MGRTDTKTRCPLYKNNYKKNIVYAIEEKQLKNELELSQEQYRILGIYRFGRSASDTKKVHHFGWTKGVTEQDSNQVRGSSNPNVDGCLHQTASQRYSKKYRILGIAIFGNHK